MSKFFGFLLGIAVALVGPAMFGVLAADGGIELNAKEMALAYGIGALIFWIVLSYFSGAGALGAALTFGLMIYAINWIPNRTTNFLNDVPGVTTGMIEGIKQYTLNGVVPILAVISLIYSIQLIVQTVQRNRRERAEAERRQREQELAQAPQEAEVAPYPAQHPVAGGDYPTTVDNRLGNNFGTSSRYDDLFDEEPPSYPPQNTADDEQTAQYANVAATPDVDADLDADRTPDADDETVLVPTDRDETVVVPADRDETVATPSAASEATDQTAAEAADQTVAEGTDQSAQPDEADQAEAAARPDETDQAAETEDDGPPAGQPPTPAAPSTGSADAPATPPRPAAPSAAPSATPGAPTGGSAAAPPVPPPAAPSPAAPPVSPAPGVQENGAADSGAPGNGVGARQAFEKKEEVGQQYRERMDGPELDDTGEFTAFENPNLPKEDRPQAPRIMDLPGQFRPAGA